MICTLAYYQLFYLPWRWLENRFTRDPGPEIYKPQCWKAGFRGPTGWDNYWGSDLKRHWMKHLLYYQEAVLCGGLYQPPSQDWQFPGHLTTLWMLFLSMCVASWCMLTAWSMPGCDAHTHFRQVGNFCKTQLTCFIIFLHSFCLSASRYPESKGSHYA